MLATVFPIGRNRMFNACISVKKKLLFFGFRLRSLDIDLFDSYAEIF